MLLTKSPYAPSVNSAPRGDAGGNSSRFLLLHLPRCAISLISIIQRRPCYVYLPQNHFILNNTDRVWSAAMKEPWLDRVEI